jgi:hypothetical protein
VRGSSENPAPLAKPHGALVEKAALSLDDAVPEVPGEHERHDVHQRLDA